MRILFFYWSRSPSLTSTSTSSSLLGSSLSFGFAPVGGWRGSGVFFGHGGDVVVAMKLWWTVCGGSGERDDCGVADLFRLEDTRCGSFLIGPDLLTEQLCWSRLVEYGIVSAAELEK
ncbi:hypothetical protein Q3G72_025749 [Acer saccharum]|nr:hypothetical protein Q3G72_025749 [Acer saccharum]